jgi:hypothetical protein
MFSQQTHLIRLAPALLSNTSPPVVESGIPALDALLPHGGFPVGRLSEISGAPSSGKRTIAVALCAHTLACGRAAFWIDGSGQFYPLLALEAGLPLETLHVIRPPTPHRSHRRRRSLPPVLKAADLLMAAGPVASLIIIDLAHVVNIDPQHLARIRLDAETSGAAVIFLCDRWTKRSQHSLGTFIALHLTIQRQGLRTVQLAIAKSKLGKMARHTTVTIDAPHQLHLDSTL